MSRRAFAILYALAALALLGAVVSLVAAGVRERARELHEVQSDAQLRQLIVAGARLSQRGVSGKVFLPRELQEGSSLQILTDDPDPRIVARFCGRQSECSIPDDRFVGEITRLPCRY